MKLNCFALSHSPPKIVPARPSRPWMDEFPDRHAYRCLPLSIANAHGLLCPVTLAIDWNGGPRTEDLTVRSLNGGDSKTPVPIFCHSHFSSGIVTFHTDYIFRTEDDWDLLATGPFNSPKDAIYPLTGIIESNWLPYPFTMNWQLTRPGTVVFEKDEPFCFIFPIKKRSVLDCRTEIHDIVAGPELAKRHQDFAGARNGFMERFHANDKDTLRDPWLKHYFKGRYADGAVVDDHVNKLRAATPVDKRCSAPVE